MKLTYFLKDVVLENTKTKLIVEISQKKKDEMVKKFSSETNEPISAITKTIDSFEKYQQGLPIEKRNLDKYTYSELKKLIDSKSFRKTFEDSFTFFKKNNENVNDRLLSTNIKKFFEIKSILPEKNADIKKYSYLSLDKLISDAYLGLLYKIYTPIFKQESPQTSEQTIKAYLEVYDDNYSEIPIKTKPINFMTYDEFEHVLADISTKKNVAKKETEDFSNIDLVYNENNQVIFMPKSKEECIKYKRGRSWCITWPGGTNRYYNYRLGEHLTIYYTIDDDIPYDNVNHIMVILVEPNGSKRCADKTNAGRWSGHSPVSWGEIVEKQPKLKNLEDLFVPKPLTENENSVINNIRNKNVGDNPFDVFPTEEMVGIWLELLSHGKTLTDAQYSNLTPELKRKYIGGGYQLTPNQIANTEDVVLAYYAKRQSKEILDKNIGNLTSDDIGLLNAPVLKHLKNQLKPKFTNELNLNKSDTQIKITYNGNSRSPVFNYIALYGLNSILDEIPPTITSFKFYNTSNITINLDLRQINKFKELSILNIENATNVIPNEIMDLHELSTLSLVKCSNIVSLPPVEKLEQLLFVCIVGCDSIKLTPEFLDVFEEEKGEKGYFTRKSFY